MILRAGTRANVCLRCQHHLSQLPRSASAVRQLPPRQARHLHDEAPAEAQPEPELPSRTNRDEVPNDDKPAFTIRRIAYEPQTEGPSTKHVDITDNEVRRRLGLANVAKRVSPLPEGRKHGHMGLVKKEKLGSSRFTSLGKESEVIVLKNAGLRYHFAGNRYEPYEKLHEPVDILKTLDSERGLIDQAQVNRNIDELRPSGEGQVSWEDFQAVEKELNGGFTTTQLSAYIAAQKEQRDEGKRIYQYDLDQTEKQQGSSKAVVSDWMPGRSDENAPFQISWLRGYVADESFTQKQKLVVLLMRQCWNLEVVEVIHGPGELEIYVPGQELELLVQGDIPALKVISDAHCKSRDDQIEVFRSRQAIRVTAAKEDARAIAKAIQNMVDNIKHGHVDLPVYPSKLYQARKSKSLISQPEIQDLAALSGTTITLLPDSKLSVYGIDYNPHTTRSTPVDTVRRLLLPGTDTARSSKHQIGLKELNRQLTAVKHNDIDGLTWRERLKSWARWTAGVRKVADDKASRAVKTIAKFKVNEVAESVAVEGAINMEEARSGVEARSAQWDVRTVTTTSVVLGHVLHEIKEAEPIVQPVSSKSISKATQFLTSTQNMLHLFGTEQLKTSKPTTSVRMCLVPNPWTAEGPGVLKRYPPVNMRFAIDETTKQIVLKDVLATMNSSASDVMLPDKALDLRFRQRVTARLQMVDHQQLPQVTDFLNASQLDVSKGPIVTPPSIVLPISHHLYEPERSDEARIQPDVDVEYLFAGLEYRSTFATDFEGWRLLYTTLDGGKADGKRAELSLRPSRTFEFDSASILSPPRQQKRRAQQFIESAYNLVDALEDPQSSGTVQTTSPTSAMLDSAEVAKDAEESKKARSAEFAYFDSPVHFKIENWLNEFSVRTMDEEQPECASARGSFEDKGMNAGSAWVWRPNELAREDEK